MESMLLAVLAGIPLVMLAFSLLPASLADAHVRGLRRLVSGLSAVQLITAIFGTFFIAFRLATDSAASEFNGVAVVWAPFGVQSNLGTVWLDGASSLMYLMVSFVGWVICRYSVQYLDGDASQGNFFRWVAFTLGAVSMMVVCGDLVTLLAAWIATSFGLHHLLLHFPDSVAAKRAAWTKFAIIRIGDVALVFSALMLYLETETIALREIFAGLTGDT
ncbi:MAG: proton-conducting transporter membrane subunit, partial [Planctomycetota bacterium]